MRFVRTAENLFGLPAGFQRVEYLQSSGGAYIDTGYVFQSLNHSTTITFKGLAAGSGGQPYHIFGSNTSDTRSGVLSGLTGNNNYIGIGIGGHGSGSSTERVATPTTPKTMTVVSKSTNKFDWIIDGTKVYSDVSFTGSSLSGISEYIFGINFTSDLTASTTVYHYKAEDNGVVVRDMIPCIDPLGVPCMYDLVGKKPYYNQGTGTFTVGRQVIPVEYLESSGEQFIDTGVLPNNKKISVAVKFKLNSLFSSNTAGIVGSVKNDGTNNLQFSVASGQWRTKINTFGSYSGSWDSNEHVIQLNTENGTILDNTLITSTQYTTPSENNVSLYLGAVNYNGNTNVGNNIFRLKGLLYYCKIYDNNTLVRDFIPCKDENNVGFMFDKVSGTCYLNAGTGAFSVGENKYTSKLRLIRDAIRIPAGYTRVEYLESTGTQYIDTGIGYTKSTKVESRFRKTSTVGIGNNLFGSGSSFRSSDDFSLWCEKNAGLAIHMPYPYVDSGYKMTSVSINNDVVFTADLEKRVFTLNDQSYTVGGTTTSGSNNHILLYTFGPGYSYTSYFIGRIYYWKQWDNDTLVRSFIPVRDENNVGYMYDEVTGQIFGNSGTGSFVVGNDLPTAKVRFIQDVIPSDYIPLKYLESTGTQYIDTGVKQDKLNIQTKFKILNSDASTYGFVLGARYSYNNSVFLVLGRNSSDSHLFEYGDNTNCIIENPYQKDIILSNEGNVVNVNGTTKTLSTKTFSSAYNVFLFACNENNSAILRTQHKTKMYYCKMVYNGVPVRDFYPALRKSDNKPGMYDRITKQFFVNQGTGEFNYEI